jgi:cyclase
MTMRALLPLCLVAAVSAPGSGLIQAQGRQGSAAWKPAIPTVASGEVRVLPVRGNVYMLLGAGGNITVHAGSDGVLLVDSGTAAMSDAVLAAVRSISTGPLRYIVNTSEREPHSGGNDAIAATGSTIRFRIATDPRVSDGLARDRASVISFLNVFLRMSAPTGQVASRPEEAWPDNTYSTPQKKLYFNDEPVLIVHNPSVTDGNSIVHFRTADVVSAGDLVDMMGYPRIDLKAGGSVDTVIQGLNRLIDITVPNRKSEAGTLVIPGHGRLADQPDVVYYQQMVAIVRDRIKDMIDRGLTLEQIKAARPTLDYDARYGTNSGTWTTEMFVEAVYASLKK